MSQATFNSQDIDPLARAIPGQSLTDTPGQWPFEKPPQIVSPKQAFEIVKNSVESPESLEDILKLLDVGISAEGVFTPDIAEIIKPPLVAHITEMGIEAGIDDINVVNNLPSSSIDTEQHMALMQKVSPQKFERIANNAIQEEEFDEMLLNMEIPDEPMQSPKESFLDMEVE